MMRNMYNMLDADEFSPEEWLVVDEHRLGVLTTTLSLDKAWEYAEALGGTMTVMSRDEYNEACKKFREAWGKIRPE